MACRLTSDLGSLCEKNNSIVNKAKSKSVWKFHRNFLESSKHQPCDVKTDMFNSSLRTSKCYSCSLCPQSSRKVSD